MVTIDRWFFSVYCPKPNSAGLRAAGVRGQSPESGDTTPEFRGHHT